MGNITEKPEQIYRIPLVQGNNSMKKGLLSKQEAGINPFRILLSSYLCPEIQAVPVYITQSH